MGDQVHCCSHDCGEKRSTFAEALSAAEASTATGVVIFEALLTWLELLISKPCVNCWSC